MTITTDSLIKPDMAAVLERTHLTNDLNGFLLPVFEAISNAMDGIETRLVDKAASEGVVRIKFENANDPKKIIVSVTDNGIGLDDENYRHFRTPFSGHKLIKRGRGFGRFIAFKVFSRVLYSSRYTDLLADNVRAFRFDIAAKNEFTFHEVDADFTGYGLRVEYNEPKPEWDSLISSITDKEVLEAIGAHFLPYFLSRWLPSITIQFDNGEIHDIKAYFSATFVPFDSGSVTVAIDGVAEELSYSLAKIPRSRQYSHHAMLLSAADRIVGNPRDMTNKIGVPFFTDDQAQKYIVIAVVSGHAFERRLNDSRTNISLAPKTVEEILSAVADEIEGLEASQIETIKRRQSEDLNETLSQNPILRLGLRGKTLREYVASKPNNWKSEEFVSHLALERYRLSSDLTKQITAAASNRDQYEANLRSIVEKIDEGQKEALAEYVIHRKSIIELMESARKFQSGGGHAPEDAVHELIFRRFTDNVETEYFEHNLWLIDDSLSFLPYISSDRSMHGKGRKAGDKVTDLMFFDDSMVLGDEDKTTLTIVEFKKPSRNDYKFGDIGKDPILQVTETVKKAVAAGGFTKTDGEHVNFSHAIRRFAYVIADLTPTMISVLQAHDFRNTWNPKVWVRYRDTESIFIEVFGYETLVETAKKRNQAFFSVLLGE